MLNGAERCPNHRKLQHVLTCPFSYCIGIGFCLYRGERVHLCCLSVRKRLPGSTFTTAVIPSFVFGLVQVDREGIVRIDDDNAVFMSGRDDVVRYHASGITVSRMEDTGELVSMCAGGVRDGSSDMEEPRNCISSEDGVGLLVLYDRVQ